MELKDKVVVVTGDEPPLALRKDGVIGMRATQGKPPHPIRHFCRLATAGMEMERGGVVAPAIGV